MTWHKPKSLHLAFWAQPDEHLLTSVMTPGSAAKILTPPLPSMHGLAGPRPLLQMWLPGSCRRTDPSRKPQIQGCLKVRALTCIHILQMGE